MSVCACECLRECVSVRECASVRVCGCVCVRACQRASAQLKTSPYLVVVGGANAQTLGAALLVLVRRRGDVVLLVVSG